MPAQGFLSPPLLHPVRNRPTFRHIFLCQSSHKHLRIAIPIHYPSTIRTASVSILDSPTNPPSLRERFFHPFSAGLLFTGILFGYLASNVFNVKPQNDSPSTSSDAHLAPDPLMELSQQRQAENAVWLNMSLRTLWRLFRKSTNALTKDVLQPVLNGLQLPDFVQSVTITKLTLGESPALVRQIQRLRSRSLNEIQYRFRTRLVGDKEGRIDIDVTIKLPGLSQLVVPISVYALDIDAKIWLGLTVVPYQPWVRFAQWALDEMPTVKLKMQIANFVPVTAIPILSSLLNKILTKDIPREFLFPNTQFIDLMSEEETNGGVEIEPSTLPSVNEQTGTTPEADIRDQYPDLAALFDTMDINNDSALNQNEISTGLIEWGYASEAERSSMTNLLDLNNDGMVGLREFVLSWPSLQNVFVPQRFWGVLTGVLLRAEDLRTPLIGFSDPYVVLRVENQMVTLKKNSLTSKKGGGNGDAFWNEGWELLVEKPKTAYLRVEVREGCLISYYGDIIPPPADPTTHSGIRESLPAVREEPSRWNDVLIGYGSIPLSALGEVTDGVWLDLTSGGGRVKLDINLSEFVDPQLQ